MKHLVETKMVEQKTERWFADDGKEFDNEKDCVVYERRKNEEKVVKEFKKLKPQFLNIPILDLKDWHLTNVEYNEIQNTEEIQDCK